MSQAGPGAPASAQRLVALLFAIGAAALVLPPLLVRLPPLLDYPNHLARMWLLAGGAAQPPLSGMYAVDWSLASTNIGIDLAAITLGRLVGAERLGPLLVALATALPAIGGALLHRRVFGGWAWWQLSFLLLAWSMTLIAGFLNFQIALGLALAAAAADRRIADVGAAPAAIFRAAATTGLLVVHPYGALFFAVLIAALAFGGELRPMLAWRGAAAAATRMLRDTAPVVLPVLLFMWLAPTPPGETGPPLTDAVWLPRKPQEWMAVQGAGWWTYHPLIDGPVLLVLILPVYGAARMKRLRVHAGLALAAATLWLVNFAMPSIVAESYWMDRRLPVLAALAYVAALNPTAVTAREARIAAAGLLAISLIRTGAIAGVWVARQPDVAALERALSHVPAGASVLPTEHAPKMAQILSAPPGRYFYGGGSYTHLGTLVVPWRQAFSPVLVATPGMQPIQVLPPRDAFSRSGRPLLTREELFLAATGDYPRGWRRDYDYLLMLNADMPDPSQDRPLPPQLQLVADEGFARLYRIQRPAARPPR